MSDKQASILVILGAGGHGRVVADACLEGGRFGRVVATDRDPARCVGELLPGVALMPLDAALALEGAAFHVAIGGNAARERETGLLGQRPLATIVHPSASLSRHAQVADGCFIAAQAVVAAGARLAAGVILNHGAVADHDVRVGAFSHVAPRAAIGGAARIGAGVLLGAGATVLPGLSVCDGATVGAGAVVCAAIEGPGVYAGVPVRRLR